MNLIEQLPFLFTQAHWGWVAVFGCLFFASIYLVFAGTTLLLTHQLLPYLAWGRPLDARPLAAGQRQREWMLSASSIGVFGVGLTVPWAMLHFDLTQLATQATGGRIALEITVLMLWNEVHFYACHRLLHTRALKRFHLPHHRSVVTTPWATYSFHPVEAALLGSVLLAPMLIHHFSFWSLAAVPLVSLLINAIGHSNYDFLPHASKSRWWLNGAHRHHLHHVCYHGNYGFLLPFMDQMCRTALAPTAADAVLNKHTPKE